VPAAAYNLRLFGAHDLQMVPVEVPVSLQPIASAAGPGAPDQPALERELARLFVEALNLETTAEAIDAEAPLFGDGLGLDSIDILEVALEVSHRYGFQLRSDDENNHRIFQSLRSLAEHVAAHRTK
jgi:acyl carrier protein